MAESGDSKPVRKSRRNVCKESNMALETLGSPMRLEKVMKLHPKEEAPVLQPMQEEVMDISWTSLVLWGLVLVAGGWLLAMLFFRGGASAEVAESAASILTNTTGI